MDLVLCPKTPQAFSLYLHPVVFCAALKNGLILGEDLIEFALKVPKSPQPGHLSEKEYRINDDWCMCVKTSCRGDLLPRWLNKEGTVKSYLVACHVMMRCEA